MMIKGFGIVLALLLSATAAAWSQSATGSNFGTPPSGSAASRSSGGGHVYVRHHDSGGGESSSSGGERDARSVGGGGGGGERDARDTEGSSPVARQASTPSR